MVPECADTQDLLGGPARGPQPTGYMRTGRVDSGLFLSLWFTLEEDFPDFSGLEQCGAGSLDRVCVIQT